MRKAEKKRLARAISRHALKVARIRPRRGGLEPLSPRGFGLIPEYLRLILIGGQPVALPRTAYEVRRFHAALEAEHGKEFALCP